MTLHPITIASYRRCMEAGVCPEPAVACRDSWLGMLKVSRPLTSEKEEPREREERAEAVRKAIQGRQKRQPLEGSTWKAMRQSEARDAGANAADVVDTQMPLTCAGTKAAQSYCQWLGGRLPTLPEFLLASRGPEPRRFPYGGRPTCDQHPLSRVQGQAPAAQEDLTAAKLACHDGSASNFRVGQRPGATSPAGLQDVLLTRGELLGPDAESSFGACAPPREGCVAHGLEPGALDGVEPVLNHGKEIGEETRVPYGFRCAWSEEKELP